MANLGIITCFDNLKKEAHRSFLFQTVDKVPMGSVERTIHGYFNMVE